jgi:hypothetical protein
MAMAGTTAHGATFSFKGVSFTLTGISVETPTAGVVDMTPWNASAATSVIVPTGEWSGGSVSVDYLGGDMSSLVKQVGMLTFSSAGFSYSRNVLLESATVGATVNDLVRGTMKFRLTDYYSS